MKKSCILSFAALLAGCLSSKSPYDHLENWLIREDPTRSFSISADLIYVQDALYVNMRNVPAMYTHAKDTVGRGRFNGVARVFSPLVATPEDVELAMEWYLDGPHDGKRPFVLVGEGKGGAMLKAYEEANAKKLAKEGLVASFYADEPSDSFVTDDMVRKIRNATARARYRAQWGRDMPEDMLGDVGSGDAERNK